MKLVSFLDSFFILSLGITFSLLLALVYHFRNRLNENEKKYEKLLVIVNDIVKKLNEQNDIQQNIYYDNDAVQISDNYSNDDEMTNTLQHYEYDESIYQQTYENDGQEDED